MDTNFLYGQQYWYIVKAVFQDGSISSSSNTTQIIIPPKKEGAIIVSLDKPAGSSYFIGSPLNIHFQSTLSGKVSVSCQSGPLQVTLKESFITSGTRYSWTPILPNYPILNACALFRLNQREGIETVEPSISFANLS